MKIIVGAEKRNEVFYAQDQDVPVQREVAKNSISSLNQKKGEDKIEDAEKPSSKGQNIVGFTVFSKIALLLRSSTPSVESHTYSRPFSCGKRSCTL